MRKISIIIWLFFICSFSWALETDSLKQQKALKYDTNYIQSKRDELHLAVVGVNHQTSIVLENTESEYSLRYNSNNPYRFGLSVNYEWISLEYSHTIPGLELNSKAKGDSESFDISLGMSGSKFRANAYYKETKGFSQENIEDLLPDWFLEEKYYPYSENLKNKTLNLSMYYTFNHRRFSNSAALRHVERQIKSAGSAVLGFVANFEGIYAPISLISHDTLQDTFLNIRDAEYYKLGINGGYMYTFAFKKKFFIHGALIPGLLYTRGDVKLHNEEQARLLEGLGASFYSRFTAGYNGKDFYGGIFALADVYVSDVSATKFAVTNYAYVKFYIGYRFPIKKRKWMKIFFLD